MPRFSRRRSVGRSQRRAGASPHVLFSRRMTALTVLFVCVCVLYGALLVSLCVRGDFSLFTPGPELPEGGRTQTVAVQAVRGEIYDRNGKPLVTNVYSYDLELDYSSWRALGGARERNELLLQLLDATDRFDAVLCATESALSGVYPEMSYTPEALSPGSAAALRLSRVLAFLEMSSSTSAQTLVDYFVNTYSLDAQTDGVPAYTSEQITALLHVYYDMLATSFGPSMPYTLAQQVSADMIADQKERSPGCVTFAVRTERVYHYPGYATHVLGRLGPIYEEDWSYYSALGYPMNATVGVSGAELAFESLLHGTDGEMLLTLDAQGYVIASQTVREAIAGQDVYLTLDIDVQIAAEDALRAAPATAGSVVALHAATGEVLALASSPSYDVSDFSAQYEQLSADAALPLLNRAVSATYAPGSLMHLLTALCSLSEGDVASTTPLQDTGVLTLQGQQVALCPLWQTSGHTHGAQTLSGALKDGCPVVFGGLAGALDSFTFDEWESALGIGQATGIEIGESVGKASGALLAPPSALAQAGTGELSACTPIQLCSMLSTLLNGGTRTAAQLLLDVRDFTTGETVYAKSTQVLSESDVSVDARQLLLHAMKQSGVSLPTSLGDRITAGALDAAIDASNEQSHALLLAYGVPSQTMYSSTRHDGVSVCVALENTASPSAATPIAAAVIEEWFE